MGKIILYFLVWVLHNRSIGLLKHLLTLGRELNMEQRIIISVPSKELAGEAQELMRRLLNVSGSITESRSYQNYHDIMLEQKPDAILYYEAHNPKGLLSWFMDRGAMKDISVGFVVNRKISQRQALKVNQMLAKKIYREPDAWLINS